MVLIDDRAGHVTLGFPTVTEPDERAARHTLRKQIAKLERRLADTVIAAFPHTPIDFQVPAVGGPRVLALGDLECLRDDLAERLRRARLRLDEVGVAQTANRLLLERMLADPPRHKFCRVSMEDIGERGCGMYQVRPRLGLVGMLAGWWHVKLSSGCPLRRL